MIFKGSSQPKPLYESVLSAVYGSNSSPGPEEDGHCQTWTFGLGAEEDHHGMSKEIMQRASGLGITQSQSPVSFGQEKGNRSWE